MNIPTPPREAALAFIFVTVLIDMLAFGMIIPVLPMLAFMALANVCWGLFVLPESLPEDRRVAFSWKNANPLGALKLLRSHPMLAGLAGSYFLLNLAHVVLPSTTVLYCGASPRPRCKPS